MVLTRNQNHMESIELTRKPFETRMQPSISSQAQANKKTHPLRRLHVAT